MHHGQRIVEELLYVQLILLRLLRSIEKGEVNVDYILELHNAQFDDKLVSVE